MAEQRYQAVLAVIKDGRTVTETAAAVGVSRQTLHAWLARYETGGLEGLVDGSHRPAGHPAQMGAAVEVAVLEARRRHPSWGPQRIATELGRRGISTSKSGVYRCLLRAGLMEPDGRRRRRREWKRWERGRPNELWQMDTVGGFLIGDGTQAKALTGLDDHSRFCVSARLMPRERTGPVCDGLRAAIGCHGTPEQLLTDYAKVFTGRFFAAPVEVLFDAICREHGIEHLLTLPRSPTTTGKDRAVPPHPASRVRHPPGLSDAADRAAGVGRVGRLLQHPAAAPSDRERHPGPPLPDRRVECGGSRGAGLGGGRVGARRGSRR